MIANLVVGKYFNTYWSGFSKWYTCLVLLKPNAKINFVTSKELILSTKAPNYVKPFLKWDLFIPFQFTDIVCDRNFRFLYALYLNFATYYELMLHFQPTSLVPPHHFPKNYVKFFYGISVKERIFFLDVLLFVDSWFGWIIYRTERETMSSKGKQLITFTTLPSSSYNLLRNYFFRKNLFIYVNMMRAPFNILFSQNLTFTPCFYNHLSVSDVNSRRDDDVACNGC